MTKLRNIALSGASAAVLIAALGAQANAQDEAGQNTGDGEFIGTIELGESKRAVQTDTAAPVTVIDYDEIQDRQAGTVAELMDSVPGVTLVNGSTPSGSGINIRGFGANGTYGTDHKVAILVDGASTGGEEIYRIGTQLFTDPYLFRSVTVNRGTVGSFEYGSGIVGGVVRLETIDASDLTGDEPGVKVAQTFGFSSNEDGFSNSTTVAVQTEEGIELLGNFSYREQHDQVDGHGNRITNSEFDLPSFLIKGGFSFGAGDAHSIRMSYTQSETAERDVSYDQFRTSTGFGNVDRDTETAAASLTYRFQPADNDLVDLEAILSYADQKIDNEPVTPGGSALYSADHRYETYKLTVKNASFVETGTLEHELRYGIELIRKHRENAAFAPGGTDERFAAFLIDDVALTDEFSVNGALRYEASEIEGSNGANHDIDALMGGASARYEFDSGVALFGSWAYTESLPIMDDLTSGSTINGTRIIDVSEKATTWEAGFSYDIIGGFLGQGNTAAIKLNYYDTELDDVTSYSAGSVDTIDLDGIEIEGSLAFASGTYVDFNANIVDGTENRFSGATSEWRNLTQDSVRATVGHRFGDWLDLSGELVHAFENTGARQADAYSVANIRATVDVPDGTLGGALDGLEVRVGVENLLDENYLPILATRPQPGRNFKLTISKIFF